MPASTILVLESAATAAASLAPHLTSAGYTVTQTTDADEALSLIVEHQLAVLDVGVGDVGSKPAKGGKAAKEAEEAAPVKSGMELCREIRAAPAMAAVPILCVASTDDVEERIGFLEAGADDVIARPFDPREVEARVEALLLRFQRAKDRPPVISADGVTMARARRVVAVYSPKGGVGTTTIATNIAVVAAQRRPDRVVLV
nr:response regulator [Chloroflexota bacterium]